MGSEVSASFGIRVRKGFFDEQNTGNGTGGAERSLNLDDFAKSLSATLRCILSHCGVPVSTPHSFVFARLASETFCFVV